MRKIAEDEAIRLIETGIFPKCKVSKGTFKPVRSLTDLSNLKNLADLKVQSFELYDDSGSEQLPENVEELELDEAFRLLCIKQTVLCKNNGKETEVLTTSELTSLIRQFNIRGEKFVLYRK